MLRKESFRIKEFAELGLKVRWLDEKRARNAYDYALRFTSKSRYGLSESTTSAIEAHEITSTSVARAWIADRVSSKGTVQIIYSESEVCVMNAQDFLDNWQDIFAPSRDDVVILHNLDDSIVFYCHEDEFEFGWRVV